MSSFIKFLTTGKLGELCIGTSADEAFRILGNPQRWTEESQEGTYFLKTGPIQVRVDQGQIVAISIMCLAAADALPTALSDFGVPTPDMTLYEFLSVLDQNAITWAIATPYTFDRQVCISVGDHVLAFFDLDARELQKLVTEGDLQ